MYSLTSVLDEFPAPPGSAYPGARAGQPGSEQDQRPYGQAAGAGTRPYGQDQKPGMALLSTKVSFFYSLAELLTKTDAQSQTRGLANLAMDEHENFQFYWAMDCVDINSPKYSSLYILKQNMDSWIFNQIHKSLQV